MYIYIYMYDTIINPSTGTSYSIYSQEGRNILQHYLTYVIGGTQSAPKKSQRQPRQKPARRTLALGSSRVYCPYCKTTTPGKAAHPNCVPCANNGTVSTLTTPPNKMGAMQRAMTMAPSQSKKTKASPNKMGAMQRAMMMVPLQSKKAKASPNKMGAMQRAMMRVPFKKPTKNSVQRTAPTIISPVG